MQTPFASSQGSGGGTTVGLWSLKAPGLDCSTNPNYPVALKSATYAVTVAGKIGGASGTPVSVGDIILAIADNAGGSQASVGASWLILEHKLQKPLLADNNLSDVSDAVQALTNLGSRIQLTATKTFYVRTPAAAVSFTNGSANLHWVGHGLSVNDPVVVSILPNSAQATITIASPGVVHQVGHGKVVNQPFRLDTTNTLPTGAPAATDVYVKTVVDADHYTFSLTPGGSAVNTSGSQAGTHYVSCSGVMPIFSTFGQLTQGQILYVKTVVGPNDITLSDTLGGTAIGTCTVATGAPQYVASTGNDSNDGSANDRTHAYLTINKATSVVSETYDLQGFRPIVQAASGAYLGGSRIRPVVGASLSYGECPLLVGDVSTPEKASNVTIYAKAGDTSVMQVGGTWEIDGISYNSATGDDYCSTLAVDAGAFLYQGGAWWDGRATQTAFSINETATIISPYAGTTSALIGGIIGHWVRGNYDSFLGLQPETPIDYSPGFFGVLNNPTWGVAFITAYSGGAIKFQPSFSSMIATGPRFDTAGFPIAVDYGNYANRDITFLPGSTNGSLVPGSRIGSATIEQTDPNNTHINAAYTLQFQETFKIYGGNVVLYSIKLPADPVDGQQHILKRAGTDSFAVTFDGNGKLIDGSATLVDSSSSKPRFIFRYVASAFGGEWLVL